MKSRNARARSEEGAALVLVLILVTVIALGLGALLTRSDTSLRVTVGLRDQAAATYNADGAMQAAINNLRNSTYNDAAGQKCFGASNTLQLNNFYGPDSAAVTCSADPKKVLIQCPSLSQCNRPGNAILTLGTVSGEDGLNIRQNTGSTFRVHGNVFSNSNIDVVNGTLNTNASTWARTSCTGAVQSTPPPSCNYGSTPNVLGDDPGYSPAATDPPVHRNLPTCTTANSVVTFLPGTYDDVTGLNDMMQGNSSCKHSTWWFKPGVYYFDFRNTGVNANPLLPAAGGEGNTWTINDGYLVAGTPVNAAGAIIASPPVPALIPGSCDNPIKNASAVGVQFIFGADSRLAIKAGQAEICGTYRADKAPVAIYGLKSGADTTTAWTGANALSMTAVDTAGLFTSAGNVVKPDGLLATWTKTSSNNQTSTVTVSGFQPPAAIPVGSVLKSAKLVAVHGNSAGVTGDDRTIQLSPTGGTAINVTLPKVADTAMHTDVIDLYQSGTGTLADLVTKGTFSGGKISYSTAVGHAGIERVDSLQLELSFVPPAFRGSSGCVTSTPYTGGGQDGANCSLVTAVNNSGNQFYVQGTTYAPKAALDITLNNAAEQVFRFGVISRSLWVKETGSFSYGGVVIEVPDDSPGFVFSMYLAVYICPKAATCGTTGSPVLRSKVALVDSDPTTPQAGARQVTILSWSRPG
jgi:Tfp pilus assembly protein PilX